MSAAVQLSLPLHTVSEANAHEHWRVRARRAKAQRATVAFTLLPRLNTGDLLWFPMGPYRNPDGRGPFKQREVTGTVNVLIKRIAPRALDDDNLPGSCKHVRDGIADALNLPNDRDPRVVWLYGQRRGKPKEYGVEISIWPVE